MLVGLILGIIILVMIIKEPEIAQTIVPEPVATTTSQKMSLQLESDGLGELKFGVTADEVLATLEEALGTPTKDTGITSSFSAYGTCPGEKIRVIEWSRLRVFFGDTKFGTQKFFQYEYTDRDTKNPIPLITTEKGLTLNSTKAELQKLYPGVKITNYTENYAQYELFSINESLKGKMKAGKVFWINAGVECSK